MELDSARLEAFFALASEGGFTAAARRLALTQSALSQRISKLEDELGVTLVLRSSSGIRLTESGERLLRFCHAQRALGEELLHELGDRARDPLGGTLRVGGYSSIVRSVLLPALSPLLEASPAVRLEIVTAELRDLPGALRAGSIDYAVLNRALDQPGLEAKVLGSEENVLVARARGPVAERYLDHDSEDRTTLDFFREQGEARSPKRLERLYLDDIYGILDGVRAGWGKAVVPRHLIAADSAIRVLPGYAPVRNPVVLHHYAQPFHSKLHETTMATLTREYAKRLSGAR